MWFSCRHKKLTKVDEKGHQYCESCGKAFVVDCAHHWMLFGREKQKCEKCGEIRNIPANPCQHKWVILTASTMQRIRDNTCVGAVYVQRCTECGELKNHFCNSSHGGR
jgi:hypothetical protein